MSKQSFNIILVVYSATTIIISYMAFISGYKQGQLDAVQGIYRITQQERDQVDPQGLHHYMVKNEDNQKR